MDHLDKVLENMSPESIEALAGLISVVTESARVNYMNVHDFKLRSDLSEPQRVEAIEDLTAWFYQYSEMYNFDNAGYVDARRDAESLVAKADTAPDPDVD